MNPMYRIVVSLLAIAAAFVAAFCVNFIGPKLVPSLANDTETLHLYRYGAALLTLVSVKFVFGAYRTMNA
jgi:hypothetical protein